MNKLARVVVVMAVCGCGVAFGQQGAAADKAPAQAKVWPPAAEAAVAADPAIWRVKGAHGTLYLMGSVHIMKPNVKWESDKVLNALAASDVLYLEIANIDDTAAGERDNGNLAIDVGKDRASHIELVRRIEATCRNQRKLAGVLN